MSQLRTTLNAYKCCLGSQITNVEQQHYYLIFFSFSKRDRLFLCSKSSTESFKCAPRFRPAKVLSFTNRDQHSYKTKWKFWSLSSTRDCPWSLKHIHGASQINTSVLVQMKQPLPVFLFKQTTYCITKVNPSAHKNTRAYLKSRLILIGRVDASVTQFSI